MTANSTTRRGNGAGWGGPAKGEGKKGVAPGSGRPQGVKNGEGKKSVADLMIEAGARETAAERWLQILNDPTHPKHAEMVAKAAERMDGAPKQQIEHGGPGAFVMVGEPEAEDAAAWQAKHAK